MGPTLVALGLAGASVLGLSRAGEAGRAFALLADQLDDERANPADPAVRFAVRLLRYLRCEPSGLAPSLAPAPPMERVGWDEAGALLAVEELRVQRRRRDHRPSGPEAWIAAGALRWDPPPAATALPARDRGRIAWPPTDERWSDEETVVPRPRLACPAPRTGAGDRRLEAARARRPIDGHAPAGSGRELLLGEAEAARALRLRLPAAAAARLPLLLDEAVLRARLGEWGEAWVLMRQVDAQVDGDGAPALAPAEAIEHALLSGLAAEAEGREADADARWQRALALPLDEATRRFVSLRRQRLLLGAGRFAEARDLLDQAAGPAAPGGGEDPVGRYLRYRGALARFRLGDEAGLLAAARALLGRRGAAEVAADPVAAATLELVQLQLSAHAFEPALIEIVESLGPVVELPRRLDALATVAFDHGRGTLAALLWGWLLEHHRPAALRPYYLGRIAAAAAGAGDEARFSAAFTSLVDEALPRPTGTGAPRARARRSIEWDRNLLLAARDAVGALAARGTGPGLRALVGQLQRYLRAVAERPPYAEITRLYRLASTALEGARGYAERVGGERAPVWLGPVRLDRPQREVPEPEVAPPPLYGPETLLCIPDGAGGCPRWLGPPPPPITPAIGPATAPPSPPEAADGR